MEKKNAWEKYPEGTKRQDVFTFAEEYRKFISSCKTERECAAELYRQAKENGFTDLSEKIAQNAKLKAGDRIVANNMGKGLALFVKQVVVACCRSERMTGITLFISKLIHTQINKIFIRKNIK